MPSISIPATIGAAAAAGSTAAATAGIAATGAAGIETASIVAASTIPAWLTYAGLGATALSGVTSAVGSIVQGRAASASANYNAQIAKQNSVQATQNANIAAQSGEAQAGIQGQKNKAVAGAITANEAASGIDVNTGSAAATRESSAELGQLDALTIKSNAVREAYGYQTQAISYQAQGQLEQSQAKSAETAGDIGAATTLLGSAGSAENQFLKYQLSSGGFSG